MKLNLFLNHPYIQDTFLLSVYFSDYNIIEPIDKYVYCFRNTNYSKYDELLYSF